MKELDVLQSYKEEIIAKAQEILRFNTVKAQGAPNMPFGEGNAKCLQYALELCESLGASTYNADNYAGHADFGEGSEVLGILGHLDVVPADEDNWVSPPFAANIVGDRLYGRGALDDKVPMIACLYAVKCLQEAGYKFFRRVRLIFGCDEESGMQCITHYFTKQPQPDMAFSPDANFPVINREKGIIHFTFNCGVLNDSILSIKGGSRPNVVMDTCTANLKKGVDLTKVYAAYRTDKEVEIVEGDCITITTKGVAAHGSQPEKGLNACWKMLELLALAFPTDTKLSEIYNKISNYNGEKWGVALNDLPSGKLTCNAGVINYDGSKLMLYIDCRHPVTYTNEEVIQLFKQNTPFATVENIHASQPLFVPEDSELVCKLMNAYQQVTGDESQPIAIGGGTYSRHLTNCVAFGPELPNEEAIIHQANEYIRLDTLMKITEIYMNAIKLLCCVE